MKPINICAQLSVKQTETHIGWPDNNKGYMDIYIGGNITKNFLKRHTPQNTKQIHLILSYEFHH